MRFFVLDCMHSSKLLEILHVVWCNSSNLLDRIQYSTKNRIVCCRLKFQKSKLGYILDIAFQNFLKNSPNSLAHCRHISIYCLTLFYYIILPLFPWLIRSVASRLATVPIDHSHSQQLVPRDFPLFKRCEWLVVNRDVAKRTSPDSIPVNLVGSHELLTKEKKKKQTHNYIFKALK